MKVYDPERNREMPMEYYDRDTHTSLYDNDMGYGHRALYNTVAGLIASFGAGEKVIDLGCGPGRLAQYLIKHDIDNYTGVDWSPKCIALANKEYPEYTWKVANLHDQKLRDTYNDYDIFVLLEVLEHIHHDIDVLSSIPSGKRVFLSVPNTWDKAHVRVFHNVVEVQERYNLLLAFNFLASLVVHQTKFFHIIGGKRL